MNMPFSPHALTLAAEYAALHGRSEAAMQLLNLLMEVLPRPEHVTVSKVRITCINHQYDVNLLTLDTSPLLLIRF